MKLEKEEGRKKGRKLGGGVRGRRKGKEEAILERTLFEKVTARVHSARLPHQRYQRRS